MVSEERAKNNRWLGSSRVCWITWQAFQYCSWLCHPRWVPPASAYTFWIIHDIHRSKQGPYQEALKKKKEKKGSHIITGISRQVTCLVKIQCIKGLFVSGRTLITRLMRGVWQILQQNLALSTNLDPETKKKGNKNKRTNKGGGKHRVFLSAPPKKNQGLYLLWLYFCWGLWQGSLDQPDWGRAGPCNHDQPQPYSAFPPSCPLDSLFSLTLQGIPKGQSLSTAKEAYLCERN